MAGNNQSPRQRMIGMMYLVLTAMLALNVQREVLDAFVTINDGIERAGGSQSIENDRIFAEIQAAYSLDPAATGSTMDAAIELRKGSRALVNRIDSLSALITSECEGITLAEADTLHLRHAEKQDDIDVATFIMVGQKEDGSEGEAYRLKQALLLHVEKVNSMLAMHDLAPLEVPVDLGQKKKDDLMLEWEVHAFYEMPFVASITMLRKIKNDIWRFESEALNRLISKLDAKQFPIDTILARVLPKTPYVLMGETYEADVVLGGFSRTLAPEVFISGEAEEEVKLPVKDGVGKVVYPTNREGLHFYEGKVRMPNKNGEMMEFPFKAEYLVARPSAVVSPIAMNVLYKGLDNPLAVSVPGMPDEKVRSRITGVGNSIFRSGGQMMVRLNNDARGEVDVIVEAEIDGHWKEMGRQRFRVKSLPEPEVRFSSIKGSGKMKASEISINFLTPQYGDDFLFNLPLTLVNYKLFVYRNDGTYKDFRVSGRMLPNEAKELIKRLRPGERVTFEDVAVKGQDGKVHVLSPLNITVIR